MDSSGPRTVTSDSTNAGTSVAATSGHDAAPQTPSAHPPDFTPRPLRASATAPASTHQAHQSTTQDAGAGPASRSLARRSQDLALFRRLAGGDDDEYKSLSKRINDAYLHHTWQYWFVAVTSNTLLFAQIVIAASLTALGAFNDRRARTATIFLGGANTIIAALITYFKTRNQPNRARQFRNDLGKLVDQLNDAEADFQNPYFTGNVTDVLNDIREKYATARETAQRNYPDLWVSVGNEYDPFKPKKPRQQNSSASGSTPAPPPPAAGSSTGPPQHAGAAAPATGSGSQPVVGSGALSSQHGT